MLSPFIRYENDWPQPQVRVAFGFVMANPDCVEAVLVVERRALEELRRLGVDHDTHGLAERGLLVVGAKSPSKNIS